MGSFYVNLTVRSGNQTAVAAAVEGRSAGEITDEYDSSPGYFDSDAEPSPPAGGNAEILCAAFDSSALDRVEEVLRKSGYDDDGYVFANERHADLVTALGIPSFSVGLGFGYAADGDLPEGLSEDQLIHVS
ncbi:MAG: hypothetical protein HY067_04380 [Betaproteobacteria bacterium]|nr:hypothetical protein [Betaproteobacteria bacterium]